MIGFRVDANEIIASGHMMRCIAIAMQCMKLGQECLFILAEEKETQRLKEKKIPYVVLNSQWNDLEKELDVLLELVQKKSLDWLVVDSYQVTVSYLARLNQEVPVLYMDDMGTEKYPVSALLHYGLHSEPLRFMNEYEREGIKVLDGVSYIPLREEFLLEESDNCRENSILITTGGTDPYNITGKVISLCLTQRVFDEYEFHVIVGSMNQYEEELQKLALQNQRIHLHKNVKNMSDYMRKCQMAVSAGGTTLFELCACGIPAVCFSFADNQEPGTKEMDRRKVMPYAGDARRDAVDYTIVSYLKDFLQNDLRKEYSEGMVRLVDGKGALRIAKALLLEGRNLE